MRLLGTFCVGGHVDAVSVFLERPADDCSMFLIFNKLLTSVFNLHINSKCGYYVECCVLENVKGYF